MSETDLELWKLVIKGDSVAWEKIIKRYQALVYAVATRAGLSMADAADCFQQTWVLLYQNRKRLQNPSRLSAWLVTTAKREAMRLRKQAGVDVGADHVSEQPDQDPLPDEALEQLELQSELEISLGELDARCRKLLEAFFFAEEEKSYEAIASSLGIAINSLGPSRRRCLDRLKAILEKNGYRAVRKPKRSPSVDR